MPSILMIDDDSDMREIVQIALESMPAWMVSGASSAAEGVRSAAATTPDLVLLDVMMPDVDGREAFRMLRENPQTAAIPVIFLSGTAYQAEREALLALGAVGVIAKPFDPFELPVTIAGIMGWPA